MAAELGKDFAKEQKIWIKRAMKGRPLFFGLQAKAAKSGKFLLSKKPGEVKPNKVKELSLYEGKDADKKNKVPGSAAMGVATGENGVLTLHFERGKALPVATKFVKHFVTREVKFKLVKKVVIKEAELLPDVPEKSDADGFQPTEETIRERAVSLAQRLKNLGDDQSKLAQKIKDALALAATDPNAADDALDELEFILGAYERLASLEKLLDDTAAQPGVAAEIVTSIRTKRLQVARQQLDSEQIDEADDNMDVAEQAIANLRKSAGLPEGTAKVSAPGPQDDDASVDDEKAAQFFRDWIAGLKPDLARLNEAKSSELPQISEHVKSVVQAIDKKDWKAATAGYKQADPLITSALKALQAKQVQQTVSAAQLTSTLGDDAKPALKAVLESSKMHHRLAAIARPRPDQDPQVLTGDFLTKSLETTDDTDLTTHLTKMNSEFLKTVISELSLDSIVRELNSSVTQQDQILGVASDLNAVIRSAMRWEAFLNQAETLSAELDELPADGSNVEQAEGLLKQYNIARANGLKAQAKTRELAAKLKTQFSSLKSGN